MADQREALLKLANHVAEGGRWYCGVTGSPAVADELECAVADLETISAMAWNLIAVTHSRDDVTRGIYRKIADALRENLSPEGRIAARNLTKKFGLTGGFRLV